MTTKVVFGVAGSGKTTVGVALARRFGVDFADGDDFHPESNVRKMMAGEPLSDKDRWPWLTEVAAWMRAHPEGVMACSALRASYRDHLRPARFVYLKCDFETAMARITERKDHFFGAKLIESQFAALEEPHDEPDVLVVDATLSVEAIVDLAARQLL